MRLAQVQTRVLGARTGLASVDCDLCFKGGIVGDAKERLAAGWDPKGKDLSLFLPFHLSSRFR
jgi:hypothetical protein